MIETKSFKTGPAGAGTRRRPALLLWSGVLALMAAGGAALLLAPDAPAPAPVPAGTALAAADPAMLAHGERLYAAACASCHGADLEGQPNWRQRNADGKLPAPPHDASGHTWHHPDAQLFAITKFGVAPFAGPDYATDMPGFEGQLSDDDIHAVIAFIKSRWPEEIRARQAAIDARARTEQPQ